MSTSQVLRNYLKTYRKRSGLSQRELTYLLGQKHRAKVSRYERNERTPALRTLIGYETIFRVVLRDLFRGVFVDIAPGILDRARTLSRVLDGQQRTRAVGQKVDFLNKVIESLRPKP